jgi:hypothetical protein
MEDMKDYPQINFFYGSASGPNLFSWYLKMQTASVSLRKDIIEFRKLIKKTHNKSCDEKSFDIHEYSEFGKPSTSTYFENTGTYIYPLRYATGKQLAGFQPGYYQSLHNVNRIQNVYVFNDYFRQDVGSDNKMKVAREENMKPFETRGLFFLGDVVRDENDNTWICVQDSKNTTYDDYTSDYAYFISFDKNALGATPAKGPIEDFRNLPSRNLAIQMTWTLETTIRNSILSGGLALLQIQNINKYAGYDMMYMYPNRDSLHAHNDRPDLIHDVPCSFSNALYRTDDNKIGIVRLIGDYTSSQGEFGSRDMSWRIYDSYTKDLDKAPRKMLLGDLMNVSVIKQYNYDRWVTLKWEIHDQNNDKSYYPSQGLRTEPLNTDDLSVWLLSNQTPKAFIQSDNRVKNMYSEPVMAFAVKRVLDVMGVYPDYKFEDGTKFVPISLMKDVDKDLFCESTHPFFSFTYNNYKEKIFINDVRGEFGLYNTK